MENNNTNMFTQTNITITNGLPGQIGQVPTVLLGRTFLLQMGLPVQIELSLTGLLGGTLLHIAFTWTNRTSTDSFTWTEISTTNRFTNTNRATTNRFTWWNIAPHCVYLDKQN